MNKVETKQILENIKDSIDCDYKENMEFVQALETAVNYIENSISKENNMCKCCKEIKFLKEIYDKRFTFKAGIVTKSKGGTATHSLYPLNYCPMCGRKFTK